MANESKKDRNHVQGMEVPGWVTKYYTHVFGAISVLTVLITWLVITINNVALAIMLGVKVSNENTTSILVTGIVWSIIMLTAYTLYSADKRGVARAYAKAELIAILGIKQDHYCKAAVELGLAHLAHVIDLATTQSCDADLLSGAFAKARTLARMEFNFPVLGADTEADVLDRVWLCSKISIDPTLIQDSPALDNRWIKMARALKEAPQCSATL